MLAEYVLYVTLCNNDKVLHQETMRSHFIMITLFTCRSRPPRCTFAFIGLVLINACSSILARIRITFIHDYNVRGIYWSYTSGNWQSMNVRIQVCACVRAWMHASMHVWMCVKACIYVCVWVCMCMCMYACMYVCTCVYVCVCIFACFCQTTSRRFSKCYNLSIWSIVTGKM